MSFTKENYYYTDELAKADTPTKLVIGSKTGKFVPNINMSKWNDEAWLNINFPVAITNQQAIISNEVISQAVGDYTFRWYVKPDGTLEYEIVLGKKPQANSFTLNIDFPEGLSFFYQDTLENEWAANWSDIPKADFLANAVRPENVVGSYAVYWNKKNNQYKTGKFCHIYRPQLIDALGNKTWANLSIDPLTKTLTISVDNNWLKTAAYPVTIDPNLGYTTEGASNYGATGYHYASHDTTDASGGNTAQLHIAIASGADGARYVVAAIYTDDVGNNRPEDQLPDATGDDEISITPGNGVTGFVVGNYVQSLSASTKYWLAWGENNGTLKIKYDAGAANSQHYRVAVSSADLVANWGNVGTNNTTRYSFYADYTAVGGGLSIPVAMSAYRRLRI